MISLKTTKHLEHKGTFTLKIKYDVVYDSHAQSVSCNG